MFKSVHITDDHAIHQHAWRLDDTFYITLLADENRTLVRIDIADDTAFNLDRSTETQIATQLRIASDEGSLVRRLVDTCTLALIQIQHQDLTPVSVHSIVCSSNSLPSCSARRCTLSGTNPTGNISSASLPFAGTTWKYRKFSANAVVLPPVSSDKVTRVSLPSSLPCIAIVSRAC